MKWSSLALRSLWNRRTTAALTLVMLAFSVAMLLTVDRIRHDTRNSFSNTLSGTDLIIGARTGSLNLLLYSVFRIGNATNNIDWSSYQYVVEHPNVEWTIPISLGDSHRGYRVIGTNESYFKHYQYGRQQSLTFLQGRSFNEVFEVVLGARMATNLGYQIGDQITLSHGTGMTSFENHDDKPFTVTGILKPTGTPVDDSAHISLEAMTAIHLDWQAGVKIPGLSISAQEALTYDLTPQSITAVLVGMKSRIQAFQFQRTINDYRKEPLMAIIPGAALAELWQIISIAENALFAVTVMVILTGLIGMLAVILASLNERRREMAILRALGCPASTIVYLLVIESGFYGLAGTVLGFFIHALLTMSANPWVKSAYGIELTVAPPNLTMTGVLAVFITLSVLIGLIPGIKAFRQSLTQGLSINT